MSEGDENADTRTGFIRQRRFLIGTSLTIFGYEFLGLSVEEINLLGNSANIENPGHIASVLVVVHAWAIYRYWVYFQELAPWRPFREVRLARLRLLLTPSNWADCHREGEELARFLAENASELERLREKQQIDKTARARDAHLAQVSGVSVSTMREEWNVPFYSEERQGQVGYVTLEVPVGKWKARRALVPLWMHVLLNRTFFSEYLVPMGLAVIAVIAYATNWFEFLR